MAHSLQDTWTPTPHHGPDSSLFDGLLGCGVWLRAGGEGRDPEPALTWAELPDNPRGLSFLGRPAVVCGNRLQILKQLCHFPWGLVLLGVPRPNVLGRWSESPVCPPVIPVCGACAAL